MPPSRVDPWSSATADRGLPAPERGLQRGGRVDLQRAQCDARQAKLRLNHLPLFGDTKSAVDRPGRLRLNRECGGTTAATDAAAAPVKQRDRDAVPARMRRRWIPGSCTTPRPRRAGPRPWPNRNSRPSPPGGPRFSRSARDTTVTRAADRSRRRPPRDRARFQTTAPRAAAWPRRSPAAGTRLPGRRTAATPS